MKRQTGWAGLAFVTAISFAGCAGNPPDVSPDDVALVTGRDIYGDRCVTCHGATGEGGSGSRLNQGNLVEKYPDPDDQRALIRAGRNAMPSFAALSDSDLDGLIRYTREVINDQE